MSSARRTIKASSVSPEELFNFNQSIEVDGGKVGKFKINEKRNGVYKIKVWQDFNDSKKLTKTKNLIFKGRFYDVPNNDELINFAGKIRVSKYLESHCEENCPVENTMNPDRTNEYSNTTERCCYVECYEGSRSVLSLRSDTSGIEYIAIADIRFQYNPEIITIEDLAC